MGDLILNAEQQQIVADNYYLVGEVMEEMKLSENDVEDWHGFLCEVLCKYIAKQDESYIDEIKAGMKSAILDKMQRRTSVNATPIGLMRGAI